MDYNLQYNLFYNRFYSIIENRVRLYYINEKHDGGNFNSVHNKLTANILNAKKAFTTSSNSEILELYSEFRRRFDYFERDHVNLIFQNKILKQFDELRLAKTRKYSVIKLLRDFAFTDCINEISRILHNYYNHYDNIYYLNEYDKFEIIDEIVNQKKFKEHNDRRFPPTPLANDIDDPISPNYSKKITERDVDLTELEKAYLFFCMSEVLKSDPKFPRTELYKLKVLSSHEDLTISKNENYKNSPYYRILSGGAYKTIDELNSQISFINNLNKKIIKHKMPKTSKHLVSKINHLQVLAINKTKHR